MSSFYHGKRIFATDFLEFMCYNRKENLLEAKMHRKIYGFTTTIAHVLSLAMTLLLFFTAFFFTAYALDMESQLVLFARDHLLAQAAALCVGGGLLFLVGKWAARKDRYIEKILLVLAMAEILLLGGLLILYGKTVPAADAWSVYDAAARLAVGDTTVIHPENSYLSYYPQQVGLMAFLELLHRIWNMLGIDQHAYHFIKIIYVLLTMGTVYAQYLAIKIYAGERIVPCLYLVLAMLNLPMIMYSSFVYSEVPSVCAFSWGAYFLLLFLRKYKRWAWIPGVVCFTLSVMLRKNALILMIAVVIVLLVEALGRRRWGYLALAVCCMVTSLTILPAVQKGYEMRSGSTLRTGVTALSYIAMGMQESSRANGWYNGFNFNTYQDSGMDSEKTDEISREAIQERVDYFKENPGARNVFYWEKYLSQWGDGTYASRQATLATFGGRNAWFESLYQGKGSRTFIAYANGYQTLLYLGALLFLLLPLKNMVRGKGDIVVYLGLIAVLGGLLFHMIWEANARYIFTYSLLLMPYAAAGVSKLKLGRLFRK